MTSLKIYIPNLTIKNTKFYLKGYWRTSPEGIIIYFIRFSTSLSDLQYEQKDNHICGCCNFDKLALVKYRNYLVLKQIEKPQIVRLVINNKSIDTSNSTVIIYDYDSVHNSEMIGDVVDEISQLQDYVRNETNKQQPICKKPFDKIPYWLSSSMFFQHLLNYYNLLHWLFYATKRDKKISIKQGNLILAVLTDIILGYIILNFLTQDKSELSSALMGILEKLVSMLYSLLKWLMGAPAGLKLNNAFNNMLGKYFAYHIQLWGLFLDVSGEKLDVVLHMFHYVGYLGFTFQAAMISDLICISTFHSYCIYVYAARLFNIQISGLTALLRLFVGRKYNPLRGGVDSCEYTNQELFVGTVAFTILLLLLPTTTMYYIVFTLFRLLSLSVQYTLARLIYLLQTLPLFVTMLWVARSPKVAGTIFIEVVSKDGSPLVVKMNLLQHSLNTLVEKFTPPVESPKQFEWANVLSNICVGKQIT